MRPWCQTNQVLGRCGGSRSDVAVDSPFSQTTRIENLAAMAAEPVDLLVIGAGITGAGIARDAAMRGIRTALLDQGDFGGGTSSRSSRRPRPTVSSARLSESNDMTIAFAMPRSISQDRTG